MNKLFFLFLSLLTSIGLYAQPQIISEKIYGIPTTQDTGNSVVETADGNVLFVGTTNV